MANLSDIFLAMINKQTISKNKWLIMWVITSLSGGAGTVAQTLNLNEAESELDETKGQVTAVAEYLTKPKVKQIIIKSDCRACKRLVREHEQYLHGEK